MHTTNYFKLWVLTANLCSTLSKPLMQKKCTTAIIRMVEVIVKIST
jgi:hypothetical protein